MQLVSVVLCSYNGIAFIQSQLDSLESQTYKNIEFICSDNNSNDGTDVLLKNWCAQHPSTRKFISHSEKGLNKNFFNAIQFATGTYVMFCDQDDIWMPEKIAMLVSFHEKHPKASMVYCLSQKFHSQIPTNIKRKKINHLEGTNIKKTMLVSHTLGHNLLIKNEVLQKIPVPNSEHVAYDWWITVSAMCMGYIACLPHVLTYWRQHLHNTTTKINEGLYYKSRILYLKSFLTNDLISNENKSWIVKAKNNFESLRSKRFSISMFLFLLKNAKFIFFYKRKKNVFSKWISFTKWSFRMSHKYFRID
ncbi:MAG: glycosyltransferase [Sphingobacteriales bacterium]|nr:glycosyltransferase [Sphingobacteriales bacterium]